MYIGYLQKKETSRTENRAYLWEGKLTVQRKDSSTPLYAPPSTM